MPQYRPVTLSNGGGSHPTPQPGQQSEPASSLQAGVVLGQAVRDEHGREGLRAYVAALNPLLPRALVEQIAHRLGVEAPPPVPPIPHGLAVAQIALTHGGEGQLPGGALQQACTQAVFQLGNAP